VSPRRKERTATFTQVELVEYRRHFGSVTHAFEILLPFLEGRVSWSTFRLTFGGRAGRPGDLDAVRGAVRAWKLVPR
jgi:hypothetical protein